MCDESRHKRNKSREGPQIYASAERVLAIKVKPNEQNCAILANGGVTLSCQF